MLQLPEDLNQDTLLPIHLVMGPTMVVMVVMEQLVELVESTDLVVEVDLVITMELLRQSNPLQMVETAALTPLSSSHLLLKL